MITDFRLAATTRALHRTFRAALLRASQIGVAGVQLDAREEVKPADLSETGRRQLTHLLEEHRLKVGSVVFPTRRPFFDQDQLDARIAGTKSAMQLAYDLKASVLTARIGRVPEEPKTPEYEILHQVIEDLARFGNHVGVTFSIIPARQSPETLLAFVRTITQGPVGISFDPAQWILFGEDPVRSLRHLHPFVTHYKIRDAVRDVDEVGLEVPVGRGEVEWDALLPLIVETEFRGWLTVDRTAGDDKPGDVARAVQYVKNVMGS